MTQQSKFTPGALAAAKTIWLEVGRQGKDEWVAQAAAIIDSKARVGEMYELLETLADQAEYAISQGAIPGYARNPLVYWAKKARCIKAEIDGEQQSPAIWWCMDCHSLTEIVEDKCGNCQGETLHVW